VAMARYVGVCTLCGKRAARPGMFRHLVECGPSHDVPRGPVNPILLVHVESPVEPMFWLAVEANGNAALSRLDAFLREIWLECCGHLSAFEASGWRYSSFIPDDERPEPNERTMRVKMATVLRAPGGVAYEYDFGSTTTLTPPVVSERQGRIGRAPVRLLARNTPPVFVCGVCGDPAPIVCSMCMMGGDGNPFLCERHARRHDCAGDGEAFLPAVNSPRVGICAYGT
jgi:hypothetical protein